MLSAPPLSTLQPSQTFFQRSRFSKHGLANWTQGECGPTSLQTFWLTLLNYTREVRRCLTRRVWMVQVAGRPEALSNLRHAYAE